MLLANARARRAHKKAADHSKRRAARREAKVKEAAEQAVRSLVMAGTAHDGGIGAHKFIEAHVVHPGGVLSFGPGRARVFKGKKAVEFGSEVDSRLCEMVPDWNQRLREWKRVYPARHADMFGIHFKSKSKPEQYRMRLEWTAGSIAANLERQGFVPFLSQRRLPVIHQTTNEVVCAPVTDLIGAVRTPGTAAGYQLAVVEVKCGAFVGSQSATGSGGGKMREEWGGLPDTWRNRAHVQLALQCQGAAGLHPGTVVGLLATVVPGKDVIVTVLCPKVAEAVATGLARFGTEEGTEPPEPPPRKKTKHKKTTTTLEDIWSRAAAPH